MFTVQLGKMMYNGGSHFIRNAGEGVVNGNLVGDDVLGVPFMYAPSAFCGHFVNHPYQSPIKFGYTHLTS